MEKCFHNNLDISISGNLGEPALGPPGFWKVTKPSKRHHFALKYNFRFLKLYVSRPRKQPKIDVLRVYDFRNGSESGHQKQTECIEKSPILSFTGSSASGIFSIRVRLSEFPPTPAISGTSQTVPLGTSSHPLPWELPPTPLGTSTNPTPQWRWSPGLRPRPRGSPGNFLVLGPLEPLNAPRAR